MKRRLLLGLFLAAACTALAAPARAQQAGVVLDVSLTGTVDPLAARYVERAVRTISDKDLNAIFVRIDTPGGLDSSMRKIIKSVQGSGALVICWVGPPGARAASAGALIMLGCPNTAMARGTNIGAAHPVGFQGEVMDEKVTNDGAAFARALAERYGRSADIAERMVRSSLSISAEQALDRGMIDLIADDRTAVLRAFEGRHLRSGTDGAQGTKTVGPGSLSGARVEPFEMSFMESVLHSAVDPNLAFILLTLGLVGILVEILHPGISVPGVVGALSFLGALVILGMLPVNLAGVVLIVAGMILLAVEAHAPGISGAGVVGVVALVLGGLFLFDASVPSAQVSKGLVAGTALAVGAFFFFAVRAVLTTRHQGPSAPTTSELIGEPGIVVQVLDPTGIVRARNEQWSARSTVGSLPEGTEVRIVGVDGLTLEVAPADVTATREGGQS